MTRPNSNVKTVFYVLLVSYMPLYYNIKIYL